MSIFTKEQIGLVGNQSIELDFSSGLNLLAGRNGAYKTKILEHLIKNKANRSVYGFSPQRNTMAQELKQAVQQIDTKQKTKESLLAQFETSSKILPSGFTEYPSLPELFSIQAKGMYEPINNEVTKKEAFEIVAKEFNEILSNIFTDIKIVVEETQGDILVEKYGQRFSVAQLSTGEREVIGLVINLEYLRETHDIFLIDEPEIHLNWSLEKALFKYLNMFSTKYSKQIIAATHSRIVFDKDFIGKTSFLFYDGGILKVENKPSEDVVADLAGEAVQYIDSFILDWNSTTQKTFFVEDDTQKSVVEALFDSCHVINCDGKEKVISIINLLNRMSDTERCKYYGLVDSDNNNNRPVENLIILSKCSVENYFLNPVILSMVLNLNSRDIESKIKDFMNKSSGKVGVFKKISEIDNYQEYLAFFPDAKGLLRSICSFDWLNEKEKRKEFIEVYITQDSGCFDEIKSQVLVEELVLSGVQLRRG